MIRVIKHRSIHDINEATWNSIVPKMHFFHSYHFIQSIEDAKVENSEFWYLLFYSEKKLAGSAVLSSFTVFLELFTGNILKKCIEFFRKFVPNFFKINILFCGLPISIGKHNLVISDKAYSEGIVKKLYEEMISISDVEKIPYLCIKEFDENFLTLGEILTNHGFLCMPSLPYVSMKMRWSNFSDYLKDMRHSYRRQIKQNLKKIGWAEPKIELWSPSFKNNTGLKILLGSEDVCSAERFYEVYYEVMQQAKVKLETLNEVFFKNLFELMKEEIEVLSVVSGKNILASAILFFNEKCMTFILVGLNYEKFKKYDAYFNLIYAILKLAIERGCSKLDLGQTSYYIKQRIGGKCAKIFFYLKSRKRIVHLFLKIFKKWLFPELDVKPLRVFKQKIK